MNKISRRRDEDWGMGGRGKGNFQGKSRKGKGGMRGNGGVSEMDQGSTREYKREMNTHRGFTSDHPELVAGGGEVIRGREDLGRKKPARKKKKNAIEQDVHKLKNSSGEGSGLR